MVQAYKTRIWKGRQQAYITNPETGGRGWYNIEEKYMTDYGREVQNAITGLEEEDFDKKDFNPKWDASTKEARLRRNVMNVLDTKIGEKRTVLQNVDELHNLIEQRLDEMSDFEIKQFGREYADEIQLFFEYKTFLDNSYAELDARTIKLLEGLGIDISEYMPLEKVSEEVQAKLLNLNDLIDIRKEARSVNQ